MVQNSKEVERGQRRLARLIALSIVALCLMLSLIVQGGFNLSPFLSPDTAGETLLLYALSTLNFLAFVTVLFVLMRNIIKLARERRARRLGSKFKTRLVGYAIGLSLLPVLLLFFFAFGLLNRSIDRWFGEPARQVVEDAEAIKETYLNKEKAELIEIARQVCQSPDFGAAGEAELKELAARHNLLLIRVAGPGRSIAFAGPGAEEVLAASLAAEREVASKGAFSDRLEKGASEIYSIAGARIGSTSAVLVRRLPSELAERLVNIREQHRNFHSLLGKIKRIKAVYILLLGAVALLLIFAASWLALYVARGITVPIQALVEATDRVAKGDFSRRVEVEAEDELAVLVESFNQMAEQLGQNREQLERAAEDLRRTNLELEGRRRYIETVLESLSTGVISLDEQMRVTTINRAALSMLGLAGKPAEGATIIQMAGPRGEDLAELCRRARRSELAQSDIEFKRDDGSSIQTATTAISLRGAGGEPEGWVIVIEDLTDLIQAERAAAWGEVARRMAHEIKNPLTPIQLSAERVLRNYDRHGPQNPRFEEILREGTATIVREVAALKRMVEEFSRFARLPEAKPIEASLNEVVRNAVGLYTDRLDDIEIQCELDSEMPRFRFDPEQIKQVLVNLIDNAAEALAGSPPGEKLIRIESRYLKGAEVARLIVSDTGHGVRPADRDKLFLPKFSTRERGTGLGLAIVNRIVSDHMGRVWVEDNRPRGARFIVELPISGASKVVVK